MEKVLHFLAFYNTQIIQAGFAIVFLLIVVYVYRVFYMANMSEVASPADDGIEIIDQKLNLIIDQQMKSKTAAAATTASQAPESNATLEVMDKLQTEIYNLRQQLSETQKHVAEAPVVQAAPQPVPDSDVAAAPAAPEMVEKIKNLESRLAEYEIIADDIAELSQLRADNARMAEELAKLQGGGSVQATTPASDPVQDAAKAAPEAEPADVPPAKELVGDVQPSLEELMGAVSDDVSQTEQELMAEFEKTIKKGNE